MNAAAASSSSLPPEPPVPSEFPDNCWASGLDARVALQLWIDRPGLPYTAPLVAEVTISALQQLFGCVGGAVLFEVLDCDGVTGRAEVAVDSKDTSKLQAAAACLTTYSGSAASLRVLSIAKAPDQHAAV
jgi:hypothetical protein